jgi:hypothetical protein
MLLQKTTFMEAYIIQPQNPPPPDPGGPVPLTGIGFLIIAAIILGIYAIRKRKKI